MWKYIVGFFVFAGLALYVMSKSGPVDLGGEHAAQEAMSKGGEAHAPAAALPAAPAAPAAPATEAAPTAPVVPAAKP